MDERQRQAWRALGLGPVWQRRHDLLAVSGSMDTDALGAVADAASPGDVESTPAPPTWASLRQAVDSCANCPRAASRTRPVFGSGPAQATWMIVGDQPDERDDAAGEPFSGAAGQLLEQMLGAIGVSRARDVFITQSVKCRSDDDRAVRPDELDACSGHLRHQIGLIRPALILALGDAAARSVLAVETPCRDLRGQAHVWRVRELRIPVVVTHDPADLLRHPEDKAQAWADLRLARRSVSEASQPETSD
jgi:uracil-DNA glycosylase